MTFSLSIGNTKSLWSVFKSYIRSSTTLPGDGKFQVALDVKGDDLF